MILVLIGGLLGWYILKVYEQHEIVAAVREAGGEVGYEWQVASGGNLQELVKSTGAMPTAFGGRVVWPKWLVDLLGMDAFGRVDKVWFVIFKYASIRGEGLVHLGRMGSLETLAILRSKIESLNDLPAIPLKNLCVPFTAIDDRGLARLRSMPALNEVFLDGTKITDTGLECLITQPTIESVHVNGTRVTASGVGAFRVKKPRAVVAYGPIQKSPYFSIR